MKQDEIIRNRLVKFQSFAKVHSNHKTTDEREKMLQQLQTQKAAVLIPLFLKEGKIQVLLTQRSDRVSSHKGEVAFPGGKQEPGDVDLVSTALREANEEVGIKAENVEVLEVLSPRMVRRTVVTPVIGLLKSSDFRLSIDHTEVEKAFHVPLEFFLENSPNHFYKTFQYKNQEFRIHFFQFTQHRTDKVESFSIYGFTAGLCVEVASVVFDRLPDYELLSKREKAVIGEYFKKRKALGETALKSRL